ncbi:MAG: phage tail tip lysozyme, partial [Janthinobacterium lividum]
MAAENVISSFLVALGYTVKADEERRFVDSLAKAKVAALALGATLTGLVATIAKVAEGYEQLYYQSQRVGASVANIQAFGYAMSQMGGSAAGAASALESMGNFLRGSPGAESFMQRLGIQTRDAHGGIRDTTAQLEDFFKVARTMPYYRARAYASVLGIDDRTLQAGMRGLGQFSSQLKAMYRAAGVDSQAAAAGSAKFMQQLRGFGAALQVLRDKVAISLERGVGAMVDKLQRTLVANFRRISDVIVGASKVIIEFGWVLMRLVGRAADLLGRLIDWFEHLDGSTKRWIETLGAVLIAWRLLNAGFLATPLGLILAAGAAVLALWDDYQTWKEGGKSLIDWAQWKPGIDAALDGIHTIETAFKDMWPTVKGYLTPLIDFLKHELVQGMKDAMADLVDLVQAADDALHGRWKSAKSHLGNVADREVLSTADDANAVKKLLGGEDAASGGALSGAGNALSRGWRFISGQTGRAESSGYSILKGLGIDRTHALAMLGNFEQESGLDPTARNGHHYGIEQWDDSRADAIKSQTGIDVRTAGYADQIKAAAWEVMYGGERKNARGFFGTGDIAGASGRFASDVERSGEHPGMSGFDNRIRNSLAMDHRLRYAD